MGIHKISKIANQVHGYANKQHFGIFTMDTVIQIVSHYNFSYYDFIHQALDS